MPIPLIAAAMIPEITKAVSALGTAKDVCILDWIHQPMITKPGSRKRDNIRIPDPEYPVGIHYQIPAWMLVIAGVLGIPLAVLIYYELTGQLGPLKEQLGLKKKKGVLGMGFLGL